MRKLFAVFAGLTVISLLLAACGTAAPAASNGAPVIQTVVVTVEVPVTAAPAAPVVVAPAGYGETLKAVQARGKLVCGVNSQVPGFGYVDSAGSYSGFDVDYCRALAAAIFGDATKVEFRAVSAKERFTAQP